MEEYRQWVLSLFSNYADYYTYYLNQTGEWEAEEYFARDPAWTQKVAQYLFGKRGYLLHQKRVGLKNKLRPRKNAWPDYVLDAYIRHRRPDVIFARTQTQPSAFWQRYRPETLIAGRLSARLPRNWHPNDFDLLYTDFEHMRSLFVDHGVDTIVNDQGFDARILERLEAGRPSPGVVFIGGLGTHNFQRRTDFFERLAGRTTFNWWGYWWNTPEDPRTVEDFPNLKRGFHGQTSGLEMFQTYHDADICLNDYVDVASRTGFNQRMFEVMGVGGFLLSRHSPTMEGDFPQDLFATYTDEDDCLRKIDYYLARPAERAEIARRGQAYVLENYSYERISLQFGRDLAERLATRKSVKATK